MTLNELKRRYPNASADFIRANADNHNSGVCPAASQPVGRVPLDAKSRPEETDWHDAARSFEVWFIVYSRRPADYDGYDIKALQDFCVAAGIIPGDGWNVLSGRVMSRKAATESEERTEVIFFANMQNSC